MSTNKRGKVIASYGAQVSAERVVSCVERGGLYDVTTEHDGARCMYLGSRERLTVGAEVVTPIRCRLKQIRPRAWSPFDGEEDD